MSHPISSGAASGVPSVPTPKTTAVLVIETAKQGVTAQQIMALIPAEIRATVNLYLDGKIQQWYSRGEQRRHLPGQRKHRRRGTRHHGNPAFSTGRVDRPPVHSRRTLDAAQGIDGSSSAAVTLDSTAVGKEY